MSCKEYWYGTIHNWDKWKEMDRGKISVNDKGDFMGMYLYQARTCKDCSFIEINRQQK